jgi:hypothetical protein
LFVASSLYELPFGKHGMFLKDIPKAFDYVVGGWQWSNVVILGSGTPIDISVGGVRPDYNGGCKLDTSYNQWLGCPANAFTKPAGLVGNLPRNFFPGPGTHTWDTVLGKSFPVTERVKTEFRVQLYNVFNTPQFQNPDTSFDDYNNGNFGKLTTPRSLTNRELEFVLRVSF